MYDVEDITSEKMSDAMPQQEHNPVDPPLRWVVMGVSGSGKSVIGAGLAARLGIRHVEGDAYHSPENIAKMTAGIPLDDKDRQGWLLVLQARLREAREQGQGLVLSCSALKRSYRDLLRAGDPGLVVVYLDGKRDVIAKRMGGRTGHFMPQALLESQFRDLEPPQKDERSIHLDIEKTPEELVEQVVSGFYLQ